MEIDEKETLETKLKVDKKFGNKKMLLLSNIIYLVNFLVYLEKITNFKTSLRVLFILCLELVLKKFLFKLRDNDFLIV